MSELLPVTVPVNFLFDIIVTRITLFKDKVEDPKDLLVNVKFNKVPVNITQSRINVTDFKAGRRTEIRVDSGTLRKSLDANGMPIVVRYKGATLGLTQVRFPQDFIDRIEVGMSDLMHAETCSIIRREQEVGILELLIVLTIKCDEPEGEIQEDKSKCRNLGKLINAQDVMFLVGEPQPCRKSSQSCLDELEPNEGDERLRLDLERYRNANERYTYDPSEDICGLEACCELKNMTVQYGHIIDSVIRQMSKLPSPMPDDECVFTDWSGKATTFMPRNMDRTIPIPVGDLEVMGVKPIRFCPVCLTPMSWLPKYASCPTCCIKPMPEFEERSEEKLTADQIIQQYLKVPEKKNEDDDFCHDPCKMKQKSDEEDSEKADELGVGRRVSMGRGKRGSGRGSVEETEENKCKKNCRCTCTKTKLCVHCRIRKLCADIFKRKGVSADGFGQECPVVQPVSSSEDFAVIVEQEEEDCRPYLERVFAELRDLYDKRDAAQLELDKRCAQSAQRIGSQQSSSAHMLKSVGSPTFLHRTPLPKIGHKACLKPQGIVSRRHGWSWTSSQQARKHGWRPGAICRYAGAIMRFFLHYTPDQNACSTCRKTEEQERDKERRKPMLNICKRNGATFITLRALNNPSIEMKPIVFKIVKSDLAVALRKLKRKLKQKGFRKCTCHRTLMMCVCRRHMEKKELERALHKECQRLGMESCVDQLVLTDTSDSEVEFDFDISPPAAMARPLLAIKAHTVNMSTQTRGLKEERHVEPRYPAKLTPYLRSYDCAVGDRYTGTAFGDVGEDVFEDGVFGFRGGGPHGASAAPGGKAKTPGVWGAKPGGPMRGGGRDGSGGGGGGGGRGGRVGSGGGAHAGRGDGPGGFGGFGGGFGGKSFPGARKDPASRVKSPPIPVRMPQRHYKAVADAEKAKKDAVKNALHQRKKGTDLIKYLEKKGAVPKPWNPNDVNEVKGKTKTKTQTETTSYGPVVGNDGLTDAQRNRRALLQMDIPPLETLARLGKGFDPCRQPCYDPCSYECCYPCYNFC